MKRQKHKKQHNGIERIRLELGKVAPDTLFFCITDFQTRQEALGNVSIRLDH
jgi:hypothetical protein